MKSSIFQDAIESSTKVFGRKSVQVVFEGDAADTTDNVVRLPSLPPSADINLDQADVIRGYRDHESMHVRCTDTSKQTLARLEQLTATSETLGQFAQYCEDIRIENAGITEYVGMRETLTAVNTHAAKVLLEKIESHGDPETVIPMLPKALQFRIALQQEGRKLIGVGSDGLYDKMTEIIEQSDPKIIEMAKRYAKEMAALPTGIVDGTIDEAAAKSGTAKALNLAEKVYAEYKTYYIDEPPPPDGGGEGDGDGSGSPKGKPHGKGGGRGKGKPGKGGGSSDEKSDDQGDEDGSGGGGGEPDDSDAGDDSGEGDGKDDDKSDEEDHGSGNGKKSERDDSGDEDGNDGAPQGGGKGGDGHGNSTPTPLGDISDLDDAGSYKSALNDVVADISAPQQNLKGKKSNSGRGRYRPWARNLTTTMPLDQWQRARYKAGKYGDKTEQYLNDWKQSCLNQMAHIEQSVGNKRAMIRRILELELQARHDRHWQSGKKQGRLHSVRLVDAVQGKESVFQKRENGRDMNTMLMISIDGSGSMSGTNGFESASLAFALSEALERTGCDIEVSMWGSSFVDSGSSQYGKISMKQYHKLADDYVKSAARRREAANFSGELNTFTSMGIITRAIVKSVKQRISDPTVRANFGAITSSLGTGTPTFDAVFADLAVLAKCNQDKKIYLHLTDGDHDTPLEKQKREDLMAEAHEYAAAIGVHMIGIGISGLNAGRLFKDFVNVRGADAYEPTMRKVAKLMSAEENRGKSACRRSA
jgi:cobalamin biosynthesis protein CobT